jgi:hypothetical protein
MFSRMSGRHTMNQMQMKRMLACIIFATAVVLISCTQPVLAQDTSQTTATQGQPEHQTSVEHGEVVYVSGNDLVIRNTDTGEVLNITVPDSARATVDGQEVSVHDLKPGMKLQRTITTTTTPMTVTTVRTIQGQVWHVNPPNSVILKFPDGTTKQYKIPKDQKFNANGQQADAFHLRKGMNVSATVISEVPESHMSQNTSVTGQMPPPPATPALEGALLIEEPSEAGQEVAAKEPPPEPAKLPKTASMLPLLSVLGILSLFGFILSALPLCMKFMQRR